MTKLKNFNCDQKKIKIKITIVTELKTFFFYKTPIVTSKVVFT